MEAAQEALDTRVQEAVQEAVQKHQEDQRVGAQRIPDWATEASLALVPLGMSPIQVEEPPASIADALPVLNSASDRLRCLEPVLAGQLEAEGHELVRMVAEHILTCFRSHDPAISLAPVVDVQWRRRRPLLEKACGTSSPPTSSESLQTTELDIILFVLLFVLCNKTLYLLKLNRRKFQLSCLSVAGLRYAAPRCPGPLADRFSYYDLSAIRAAGDTPDPRMRLSKHPWA